MPASSTALAWERTDEFTTIAERLAAMAARSIVEGRHAPGSWLVEADLAELAGASRTPAREAMLLLQRWGLVRLVPKKGAVVTSVDQAERRDLLQLRVMFETAAVRARPTDSTAGSAFAGDLDEILARQAAAVAVHDVLASASTDYAFHARVIQEGGNQVVAALLGELGARLARLTYRAVTDRPERMGAFLSEHRTLRELAIAADADAYSRALEAHLTEGHHSGDENR